jgi:thiosulfate dehydrogenase [quinone] large subunit
VFRNGATLYARLALAAGFLAAVTDRLGFWGPIGTANVAWGDMNHFVAYAAKLNPWFPNAVIPALGWIVTVAETTLGTALLLGFQTQIAARMGGWLMVAFAIGMTAGTGFKSALNASVFAASAAAFLLAHEGDYPLSLDCLLKNTGSVLMQQQKIEMMEIKQITPDQKEEPLLATGWVAILQGDRKRGPMTNKEQQHTETILAIFRAIEERNAEAFRSFLQPDFEIHWPPSLPYGGTFRGLESQPHGWGATWQPLQPTETERKMDARVICAQGDDVVVLWHQRGRTTKGDRLDVEVLGLYRFREGKLARAQMFYFDTMQVANFLTKAQQ